MATRLYINLSVLQNRKYGHYQLKRFILIVKYNHSKLFYSKTCLKRSLNNNTKNGFKVNYSFMQVKSIAECSKGSILQYFRPSLSYHLSLRTLFCLFLSGRLRQGLLYFQIQVQIHKIFARKNVNIFLPISFNICYVWLRI